MPVEIQLLPSFKLGVKENTQLHLPTIQIVPIKSNIPYISRITCIVRGTPNELAAQMHQQNELKDKLNASVVANDILNSIFPQVINSIPEKQPRVKLVATRLQPTEVIVKRSSGRPRKQRNPVGRPQAKKLI